MINIISWNVNGLNAAVKNGFMEFFGTQNADIFCLQETKVSEKTMDKGFKIPPNYHIYWNQAKKAGYSGTMILSKIKPLSIKNGIGYPEADGEGRVQTAEFDSFYLLNCYFPNSQRELARLDYKLEFNQKFLEYIEKLKQKKHVIITGDFNVAHKEIDIANPKSNMKNAGFTFEEREWFTKLLETGYIDTFRLFCDEPHKYTWWSYMHSAREKNIGWRLDYFVVNSGLKENIDKSEILDQIKGSDHCPVRLTLK